jgi:hypothetical protein
MQRFSGIQQGDKAFNKFVHNECSIFQSILVSVYFSSGGIDIWNGTKEKRGFYIGAIPAKGECVADHLTDGLKDALKDCFIDGFFIEGNDLVSLTLSPVDGLKEFVIEADRYSKKKHIEAIKLSRVLEKELISAIENNAKASG